MSLRVLCAAFVFSTLLSFAAHASSTSGPFAAVINNNTNSKVTIVSSDPILCAYQFGATKSTTSSATIASNSSMDILYSGGGPTGEKQKVCSQGDVVFYLKFGSGACYKLEIPRNVEVSINSQKKGDNTSGIYDITISPDSGTVSQVSGGC